MRVFGLLYVRVTREDPEELLAAEYLKGVSDEMKSQKRAADSGKKDDYWIGYVDGLHDGSEATQARRAEKSARERSRQPRRPIPAYLQLVTS